MRIPTAAGFALTECSRTEDVLISGVYETKAGRPEPLKRLDLAVRPSGWGDLMPDGGAKAAEPLDKFTCGQFGYYYPGSWKAGMLVSGRPIDKWPDSFVADGPDGREMLPGSEREGNLSGIRRLLRYGYAVKWNDPGPEAESWLWADAYQPARPAVW